MFLLLYNYHCTPEWCSHIVYGVNIVRALSIRHALWPVNASSFLHMTNTPAHPLPFTRSIIHRHPPLSTGSSLSAPSLCISLSLLVLVLCGRSKTQTPTPSLLVPYLISRTPARVHSSYPLARQYFIAPAHDNNKDNPPHTHAHTSNASRAAGHSGHPNVTVLGDISVTLLPPTPCA